MSAFDLLELSRQLKQERLFVNAEREQLHQLNTEVSKTAEKLYCVSWITRKQKANLYDLVRAAKEVTPVACCQKANALDRVKFIDGYKCLSYHEINIGECLKTLKGNPNLVAMLLMEAEKEGAETLHSVAQVFMSGIYGNSVMQEDESLVLQVLKSLIELQILPHSNPRKLLRKESCAFSVFFKLLIEGLFSSKLYLTAALHKPVMQLLMEDEWFYDIDPERALYRFPAAERSRRFGAPDSPDYIQKVKQYRDFTTQKLVMIAERFVSSIGNNMYCFPQSLNWIVSQVYHAVSKSDKVSATEAQAMCDDLVLALFICPAICDPEPYGITTDAPISYVARHNLMQVAQILQVLAINNMSEVDPRQRDLYERFEKDCMAFLLRSIFTAPCIEHPPQMRQLQAVQRTAMYMSKSELTLMLSFLRNACENWTEGLYERTVLQDILQSVPSQEKLDDLQRRVTPSNSPNCTPPGTPGSGRRQHRGRGAGSGADKSMRTLRGFLTPERHDNNNDSGTEDNEVTDTKIEDVLMISLGVVNECPGMESEQKVLEAESRQRKARSNTVIPGEDNPISESEINANEKRTRFSLSHDQDSIATSDNLEAISEAASSHSVGSDIDNDNLSDMVSANVSGRGTPSISGRDTPLSQATCETDSQIGGDQEVEERRQVGPDLPVTVQKNNREDVTDKFQKFEIKHELERDDIKSTVSDTWSTDVFASDSEPPEQNQLERLDEIAEEMVRQNLLGVQMQEASENIETASDAWSTDVLASDTSELQIERLRELEQEEVSSISSRSQIPDDVSDTGNANEDTPQPSSPHSTCSDDRRPSEDLGAMGGNDSDTFNNEDDSDVFPFPETDTRHRYSDTPPNPASTSTHLQQRLSSGSNAKRELIKNTSKQQHSSASHSRLLQSRSVDSQSPLISSSTNQTSASSSSTHNASALQKQQEAAPVLDVLRNQFVHSSHGSLFREVLEIRNSSSAGTNTSDSLLEDFDPLMTSSSTVKGGVRSRGAGSGNSGSILVSGPAGNLEVPPPTSAVIAWDSTGDSGLISMESSTNSIDTIDSVSSQISTGLKLTEQQNVNIDAQRLSAVVNVFDPLSQQASDGGGGGDTSESSSSAEGGGGGTPELMFAPPPLTQRRENPFNRAMYQEQGARPKVTNSTATSSNNPKILLQLNDKEISSGSSSNSPSASIGGPATSSGGKTSNFNIVRFVANGEGKAEEKGKKSAIEKGVVVQVETDGSFERTLNGNKDNGSKPEQASSTENIAATHNPARYSSDGVEKLPEKKKSNPSLFRSIKDTFKKSSLGMSPMHRGGSGGKGKRVKGGGDKDGGEYGGKSGGGGLFDTGATGEPLSSSPSAASGRSAAAGGNLPRNESGDFNIETTDDILAKYRKPAQSSPLRPQENGLSHEQVASAARQKGKDSTDNSSHIDIEGPPDYDPNNLENCKAFKDAKKKLRLVLSNADFQAIPLSSSPSNSILGMGASQAVSTNDRRENELVAFLKAQLAEAINLQDKDLIARLHETIRCLSVFNNYEIKKLLKSIREEHRNRSPYTLYLIRCRQGLLGTQAHLERLLNRVERDKSVVNKYFLSVYVRMFLEKRERMLHKFIQDFQKISLSDEKTNFVESFLASLHTAMDSDPVWQVAREDQVEECKFFIERNVMSHIYTHAMYPNGDGDMDRDKILHQHISQLAKVITPKHNDLRISKIYHYECPWPAAQNEIYMINAYKTPKDKLQCVLRCSSTIMNLLSLANENSVPAADDFMPVLIYVLIKANPPSLLSTLQYVNSFYENRLQGEEHYWWMQFTSAIVFIKTMDYNT